MYVAIVILIILSIVIFEELLKFNFYKKSQYYKNTKIPYKKLKQDSGRYGEYLVYKNLEHLDFTGCKFLFNLIIPKDNNKTTEIDVLLLSPKGIFVIESKNFSGWIFGDEKQENWTQTFKNSQNIVKKEKFYNPIFQNRMHIKCLKNIIGNKFPIYSIIAFSDKCTFKDIAVNNSIPLLHYSNLPLEISALYNRTHNDSLTKADIIELYSQLVKYSNTEAMSKENFTEKPIIKETKEIINDTNIPLPTKITKTTGIELPTETSHSEFCPKCGGKMVFRNIKKEGQKPKKFYGCSNFPKCKYTEKYHYKTHNAEAIKNEIQK